MRKLAVEKNLAIEKSTNSEALHTGRLEVEKHLAEEKS
jgi:hypothetical protein